MTSIAEAFRPLLNERRWHVWRFDERKNGKLAKVPYNKTSMVRANDPSTWMSYDDAVRLKEAGTFEGLGIQLGQIGHDLHLVGLDLDTCRSTASGEIAGWAVAILEAIPSYAEISPSGTGLKVFFFISKKTLEAVTAKSNARTGKTWKGGTGKHPPCCDLYFNGRYFAVTGQHWEGSPDEIREVSLEHVLRLFEDLGPTVERLNSGNPAPEAAISTSPAFDPPSHVGTPEEARVLDELKTWFSRGRTRERKAATQFLQEGAFPGMKDPSRSGQHFHFCRFCHSAGFSEYKARQAFRAWNRLGFAYKAEHDDNNRDWSRSWENSRPKSKAELANEQFKLELDGKLGEIQLEGGKLPEIIDQIDAIISPLSQVFRHELGLVRIIPTTPANQSSTSATPVSAHIDQLDEDKARDFLMRHIVFWVAKIERSTGDIYKEPVDLSRTVAKAWLSRPDDRPLPWLQGIISVPTLRADNSVLRTPGYDSETQLYLAPPAGYDENLVPVAAPSFDEGLRSLCALKELLREFPFELQTNESSSCNIAQSIALSAMLASVVRLGRLDVVPMHVFEAPTPGSGKSYLADLVAVIGTGDRAHSVAMGNSTEELEKSLRSSMLNGDMIICLDNVERTLEGDLVAQMVTQKNIRFRVLGTPNSVTIRNRFMMLLTGNNPTFGGDMSRRMLRCRLDPRIEKPEFRHFELDPVSLVLTNRLTYVTHALTVLRSHLEHNPKRHRYNGFQDWSDVVRSALMFFGEPDPVKSLAKNDSINPELEDHLVFLQLWEAALGIGIEPVTIRQLVTQVSTNSGQLAAEAQQQFHAHLVHISRRHDEPNPQRLGSLFRKWRDRQIKGLVLRYHGQDRTSTGLWSVHRCSG
jgi:putative DNA primase/helicase